MGFPMGYSEFLIPKLVQVIFLLSYVRRFVQWTFSAVGLGDLLDSSEAPWPHHHHHRPHEFHSVSALLIEEMLPVVKYHRSSSSDIDESEEEENCAVCLYELEGGDEVRRLGNCRHVFHRRCIDRWIEHEQHTCPLCRTPLIPDEMQGVFNDRMWAAAGIPDSVYSDSNFLYDY